MHEILLLINPLAKKKHVEKIADEITNALTKRAIAFQSFTHDWPASINCYKEVWIVGGDGTLNYSLNLYKDIQVPISIFKGGTGNDFATRLYGKRSVAEQVDLVLNAIPKYVDAAKCNGRKYINGVGIGFDGEVLKSISSIRSIGGHAGYLWVVLQKIFSYSEQSYKIVAEDFTLNERLLLLMITNSSTTGGGFKVSPLAKIDDGKLDLILCKPLSIFNRLRYLSIIEKGKHLQKHFIQHKTITSLKIECEKETLAQIDGELFSAKTFEIKVLPGYCMFKY